jgi:hypothetical protein
LRFVSTDTKPALDENAFQQLLAAAYVVQEHTESLRAAAPRSVSAQKLLDVAQVQAVVQGGGLDVPACAKLIADNLLKLVGAAGVSVSLITNGFLDCVAESGSPARIPGSSVASHSLVATERLKAGSIFEATNASTDIRLDIELCKSLRVESLVAAPVLSFGQLAGLVEVRWDRECAFQDADVAVCCLMAELITEKLEGKSAGTNEVAPPEKKQAAAAAISDPPSPELPRSETLPATISPIETAVAQPEEPSTVHSVEHIPKSPKARTSCRVCGRAFGADETYCGFCSMPRFAVAPSKELQSKWASLWYMQQAQGALEDHGSASLTSASESRPIDPPGVSEVPGQTPSEPGPSIVNEDHTAMAQRIETFSYFKPVVETYADLEDEKTFGETNLWSRWESLLSKIRLKDALLLCVALALAFGVASAWPSSDGQLTWFQSTMIRLGIYHTASRSPVYGNPDLNVWVDARTSLYYCPGSEQYGNTTEGHFTTQREALQAHSQPASGLACQ